MFNIPKTQPALPPLKEPKPEPERQKKLLPNIDQLPKSDSKTKYPVGPPPSRDKVGDPDGQ